MTTIYKITLWPSKGHPTPTEAVFMGHEAEAIAKKCYQNIHNNYRTLLR